MSLKTAKKEWRKEKLDKSIYYFLLSFSFIALFLFVLVTSLHLLEITGHATSVTSQGGYITEVNLASTTDVDIWGGVYGLVLRVPDFTQQLSEDLDSGTIERSDVFFDCIQTDAEGGPEIYASTSSSVDLLTSTVSPGTVEMVDDLIGCSGEIFCANNTFTRNISLLIGSSNITDIPSTFTYKANGDNEVFDIGVLNVSGELVFVSKVNATIQAGYNPNFLVNYQMLLPTPANTTQTYYFYTDPNDSCPSGGIGTSINATIHGYIFDSANSRVENATITVAGYSTLSNASGFYNLSTLVLEGTYNYIVQKDGFDPFIGNITVTFSNTTIHKNATIQAETPSTDVSTVTTTIFGKVTDTGDNALSDVNISLGNTTSYSNSSGLYSFTTTLAVGSNPIIAFKTNYDNYYELLNFTSSTTSMNHNITMSPANLNPYETGPFTEDNVDDEEGDETEKAKEIAEELGQDFWVSTSEINKQVRENTFIEEEISIYNFKTSTMQILFSLSPELEEIIELDRSSLTISPDSFESLTLTISGTKPIGVYRGTLTISGDLDVEIPVKIEIVPRKFLVETLSMEIDLLGQTVNLGSPLKYRLDLQNLLTEQNYKIDLRHLILNPNGTRILLEENEQVEIQNSLSLIKEFIFPENITEGEYLLSVEAKYLNFFSSVSSPFTISRPLYLYAFFGIPLWIIFLAISLFSFTLLNFFLYHRHVQKKKRYHLALNLDTLPKPGERSIKLGKIAEKKVPAYYNLDDLTTHAIVAGATGGGKSISAQVFVEEALEKDIAVLVFDPTAQWSGMLRKCEDKKMLAAYSKFGLKPTDAKSFPGNVRQIQNEKESINIQKYINPGQIQVFTLNKLTPQQIDIFVAGVINNIFKSDPKENPGLRVMLVFDEVHRLLPKFGGSGKGFLQIERACREFRKWGFGVMLVSQVLSDFVGEIKANINTEVQMRVAEENDLERIRERYGLDALKSLVRAGIGTGMVQNAEYNKGRPYFVSLRPILHNTRRLSDETLEKYNKYNQEIEDLEYQIEQLEGEKVDTFDLKMELKLVKDKLMTGNFTVVDIYLEGLKPRLEKQWASLGKKPKKKEIELINVEELESTLTKAKEERQKWEEKNKPKETSKDSETSKKPEDKGAKIVASLTFDNGMMVSSLNELKEVLPNFDDAVFKTHVNQDKNDIADWVAKQIDPVLGQKLRSTQDKAEMIKILESFGKEKSPEEPKEETAKKPEKENSQEESKKTPEKSKQETSKKLQEVKEKSDSKTKKNSNDKKEEQSSSKNGKRL